MTTFFNGTVAVLEKDKYIVVLPCFGSPYIHSIYKHKETDNENMKNLQDAVMGHFTPYDRKNFVIYPSFCENNRWDKARQMMTSGYTKVYVNEDGIHKCGVNMGTVITNPAYRVGGCPHLMGDVALVVPKRVFELLCPNPLSMTLEKNPATSGKGENGVWEFDDDEETDAFKAKAVENGWDFNEHNGFCYKAVMA
jgi:hypothetical protein